MSALPWLIGGSTALGMLNSWSQASLNNLQYRHQQVMDNFQTRLNNENARYQSERQYQQDQYAAKRAYQQGRFEAEALSLQGQADQAYAAHREAMSEANARRERMNLQHQADMARINANLARLGKTSVRAAGDHAIAKYSLQAGNSRATARANLAANGVVLDDGSSQTLMDSADLMRHIDMQSLENNAIFEAFGYENRAQDLMNQAAMLEANKASVHGEYYGSRSIRTQYSAPEDMSPYVTRTPATLTPEMPVYKSLNRPWVAAARTLLGGAADFAKAWYAARPAPQGNPYANYGIGLGNNGAHAFAAATGKLRWS